MIERVEGSARLSDDGKYRWWLHRRWDQNDAGSLLWVMLNPSTADALADDPTIRRCIAFSRREGYGGLTVVNLYAVRATDPKQLTISVVFAQARENADVIRDQLSTHTQAVAAWGASWAQLRLNRPHIEGFADDLGCELLCLGKTKGGHPRHPLYVKGDTPLVAFP